MKKAVKVFMFISSIVIFSSCKKTDVACIIKDVKFVKGHNTIIFIPVYTGKATAVVPENMYVPDQWEFVADCGNKFVEDASEVEVCQGDTILLKVKN